MIDLSTNKFATEKFDSKKGLSYRFSALKKLQQDAEIGMGINLELIPYLELKQLPLETIHLYFEMFIKEWCVAYSEFVENQNYCK